MSEGIRKYFDIINSSVKRAYSIAKVARSKGLDPELDVEIPLARNMAERVESLIGVIAPQIVGKGLAKRIEEFEREYGKLDWRVALQIALEVAQEKFCKFKDGVEAISVGVRVGFAYVTNGVVASPLEGFLGVDIRDRKDGKGQYMALNYAGPVRSAGGTGASVSVLIADYLRKKLGYSKYDPTEKEIKRAVTELTDYHERVTNLQYFPSEDEIVFLVSNLPVQIDGDPTEELEVSNYKDLDRIATNRVRNGFCLVIGECLAQKAPKLWKQISKWGKDFEMDDWFFLEKFVDLQKKIKSKKKEEEDDSRIIKEDYTFIKDLVAGRPIISHPSAKGGLRLRYGRARNTGLSGCAIHPATMAILNNYIAIGTQLKWERPSKGTAIGVCDYIEGPIVKLRSGEVLFLDEKNYKKYLDDIEEILFLGDALVPYGDFLNRAHVLVPPGYCEEYWIKELQEKVRGPEELAELTKLDLMFLKKLFNDPIKTYISAKDAIKISKATGVALHPRYTFHWKDINQKEFLVLLGWLGRAVLDKNKVALPLSFRPEGYDIMPKRVLEILGVPHRVFSNEYVIIEKDWAVAFMVSFGIYEGNRDIREIIKAVNEKEDVLKTLNKFSEVLLKDKSGVYIGARMGRPEKAKIRKLTGSPHVLFPVGAEGGRLRSFQSALEQGKIKAEFPLMFCEACGRDSIYVGCEKCGNKTRQLYFCKGCNKVMDVEKCEKHGINSKYKEQEIDIKEQWNLVKGIFDLKEMPPLVKGVRGTSNKDHVPEHLAKGVLRAIYNLYVNKDGTIRYDVTELPITHFKPKEIGTSVEKLRELGYEKDIFGDDLVSDNQILEIKPQDVILPSCKESSEEGSDSILFRTAKFLDDLLRYFYKTESFYNLESKQDLVGHLIVALAPHVSAGIICRIIGFSRTQGFYAHPLVHCAVRRDCDGDEVAIILLLDALINFSRRYLPAHRGATQDTPIVITPTITPSEVDDMVFDMDVVWEYPLEFYRACEEYKMPWEVSINKISDRLGTAGQFEGQGFTHDVSDINFGVVYSAYKKLPTMQEKVVGQMELAGKIRAVNEHDVAQLVIDRHFLRDIKGNLRKFSSQQFRCVDCNEKYRRPPLVGKCLKCGGKLLFTVSAGSVMKYLKPTLELASKYKLHPYMRQSLELLQDRIYGVFGKDSEKQEGLGKWF
jgi:DNA polymerase II large subunit